MPELFGPSVGLRRLVDAVNTRDAVDRPAAVVDALRRHDEVTTSAEARRLLPVLDALDDLLAETDPAVAARRLNAELARHTGPLRLVVEPGAAWHLHADADTGGAPELVDWFRASSLLAMAVAFAERGAPAWGRCAASGCENVYAIDGPGRPRTTCSPRCASRRRQAALRDRRRGTDVADARVLGARRDGAEAGRA